MSTASTYDRIGVGYRGTRGTDPILAARIWAALGDARTVLNVGAGTGSYEPRDRWVLAVEPSAVMIAQRAPDAAPVIRATAEDLPLADQTIDAAMAILTVHHWPNVEAGLRGLTRVARDRIVIVTMDVSVIAQLWVVRDYLPELLAQHADIPTIDRLCSAPNATSEVLPVPRDCGKGSWRRGGRARRRISIRWYVPQHLRGMAYQSQVDDHHLRRLREDLDSGEWQRRYSSILARDELDVGSG